MALLAYFDASGDESLPALCAGGYIAHEERWVLLDQEWEKALAEFGVSEFHMTDFALSWGEFVGWKSDEARRVAFLQRLTGIIKALTRRHVTVSLFVDVYHKLNKHATIRERLGSPYLLTMLSALISGRQWRDEHAPSEPITFYIEHGDRDQGLLQRVLDYIEFPHEVRRLPKRIVENGQVRYVRPFQAADFLVYEGQKAARTLRERGVSEIKARSSFHNLIHVGIDLHTTIIDVHALGALARAFGVTRREEPLER